MLLPAPSPPAFPAAQAHTSEARLRFEELAQDGRLIPLALPPAMGGLWRGVLRHHPMHAAARATGVVPLLTRLTLGALEVPLHLDEPVESRAGFELACARDPDGEPRIFLNVWAELLGARGQGLRGPAGAQVLAGRLFAEHTFTRPFAPAGQRRVTRLAIPGVPEVPEAAYAAPGPASAGELPPGGRWLDELAADPVEVPFTLDQTDANQHVNSLVYVRVFLDAVQRRLAAAGLPLAVLSRELDIAYRKPSFAGDRVRVHARLFEVAGGLGAAGFVAAAGEEARPRCYVRALLRP